MRNVSDKDEHVLPLMVMGEPIKIKKGKSRAFRFATSVKYPVYYPNRAYQEYSAPKGGRLIFEFKPVRRVARMALHAHVGRGDRQEEAKDEAEKKAKDEAEKKAKDEAEKKAKDEAEKKAKDEAEKKAKDEASREKSKGRCPEPCERPRVCRDIEAARNRRSGPAERAVAFDPPPREPRGAVVRNPGREGDRPRDAQEHQQGVRNRRNRGASGPQDGSKPARVEDQRAGLQGEPGVGDRLPVLPEEVGAERHGTKIDYDKLLELVGDCALVATFSVESAGDDHAGAAARKADLERYTKLDRFWGIAYTLCTKLAANEAFDNDAQKKLSFAEMEKDQLTMQIQRSLADGFARLVVTPDPLVGVKPPVDGEVRQVALNLTKLRANHAAVLARLEQRIEELSRAQPVLRRMAKRPDRAGVLDHLPVPSGGDGPGADERLPLLPG